MPNPLGVPLNLPEGPKAHVDRPEFDTLKARVEKLAHEIGEHSERSSSDPLAVATLNQRVAYLEKSPQMVKSLATLRDAVEVLEQHYNKLDARAEFQARQTIRHGENLSRLERADHTIIEEFTGSDAYNYKVLSDRLAAAERYIEQLESKLDAKVDRWTPRSGGVQPVSEQELRSVQAVIEQTPSVDPKPLNEAVPFEDRHKYPNNYSFIPKPAAPSQPKTITAQQLGKLLEYEASFGAVDAHDPSEAESLKTAAAKLNAFFNGAE